MSDKLGTLGEKLQEAYEAQALQSRRIAPAAE